MGLLAFTTSVTAQEGYLSATVKLTVDPQQLNLDLPDSGIDHRHEVFQHPISFWVNLWTDNSMTINAEARVSVRNFTTGATESMGRSDNLTGGNSLKLSVPGAESTDTTTNSTGVSLTSTTLGTQGWAITHAIEFKLEGDKVSVVITSTVDNLQKKMEIPLGVVRAKEIFKTFASNPFLEGKEWLMGTNYEKIPAVLTNYPPASFTQFLDYTVFGKRGFVERERGGSQFAWVVVSYTLYRGYSGGRLVSVTIQPDYEKIETGEIQQVILRKVQFEQQVIE